MRHSKQNPEVNAGSMADIAFLLLIFFLVTATISSDEGINRKLSSECPPGTDCTSTLRERNILRIMINNKDKIMVEGEVIPLEDLKVIAKNFIDNNGDNSCVYCSGSRDISSSDNPKKAVVSLQNGVKTSYAQFVAVQNELSKAYYELRQNYSLNILEKPVKDLTKKELIQVKHAYPFKLSEAETN